MRTNIVIDDHLMDDALRLTGFKTKKQAVEAGLKMLVRLARQEEIRKLRGQIPWQGDLDEMRRSESPHRSEVGRFQILSLTNKND